VVNGTITAYAPISSLAVVQGSPLPAGVPGAPRGDSLSRFVQEALADLGGAAGPAQINKFYTMLLNGASRKSVARKMVLAIGLGKIHSHLGIGGGASAGSKVATYYAKLFDRPVDFSGLRSRSAQILAGNEVGVVAGIIASDEFFNITQF